MAGDGGSVRVEIPGYEQFELLGTGGFSRVWKAYQPRFRRPVAVKILNFDIVDERAIKGFERECFAMGQVSSHPNIVTVLDNGLTGDDRPFIVMEYFEGGTYSDKLAAGSISIEELLRVGVKISGALQTAHDAGILHRDLKPHNIFVSKFNEPALGDFGISTIDQERTSTGSAGFTVYYAPPEVLDGRPATVQSDLYSLGATFYRLIEGVRPFDGTGQSVVATAVRIINEPVPRIGRSDCPDALRRLISGLMAKSASDRPETATDVAVAFQEIQRGLGLAASEIILESSISSTAAASAEQTVARDQAPTIARVPVDQTGGSAASMTVSRPVMPESEIEQGSTDEADEPTRTGQQRIDTKWLVAGGVVAALVVVLALWGITSVPEASGEASSTTIDQADDLFSQPSTPRDVEARFTNTTTVEVSWSDVGTKDGDVFQILRVDSGAESAVPVQSEFSPVIIRGIAAGEEACFEVSMVRSGRVSSPSPRVCATR